MALNGATVSRDLAAAVVGVHRDYSSQRIKAGLVPRGPCDESEIIAYCRDRVADFEIPRISEFRTELPKSSAGKILRKEIS